MTAESCPSLSLSSGIQFPSRKRPLPAFALLRSGAGHTVQCSRFTGRRTPLRLGPGSPGGSSFNYVVTVGGSKDDASLGILTPSVYIYLRSFAWLKRNGSELALGCSLPIAVVRSRQIPRGASLAETKARNRSACLFSSPVAALEYLIDKVRSLEEA